jgi:hypothetical protein
VNEDHRVGDEARDRPEEWCEMLVRWVRNAMAALGLVSAAIIGFVLYGHLTGKWLFSLTEEHVEIQRTAEPDCGSCRKQPRK